jgi:hypothetical protein
MNRLRTLSLAALLGAALPASALDVSLAGPASVAVGQNFSVDVVVSGVFDNLNPHDEWIAFGFDVAADNLLAWTGASVAAPFDDDSTLFANADMAGSSFPGLGNGDIAEPFTLATLNFTALAPGLANLSVASTPGDFNQGLIYMFSNNAHFSAGLAVAVVPEPSAWALLLAGLGVVGLMVMRLGKRWPR